MKSGFIALVGRPNVGKNGSMIKEIGIRARKEIELLLGKNVYLDLFVKVIPKWRDREKFLNGGVVDTECAYRLFDGLVEKVTDDGYVLCIGHTPVLIGKEQFEDKNLEVLDKVGYDKKSDSVFQYYLAKRKQDE